MNLRRRLGDDFVHRDGENEAGPVHPWNLRHWSRQLLEVSYEQGH